MDGGGGDIGADCDLVIWWLVIVEMRSLEELKEIDHLAWIARLFCCTSRTDGPMTPTTGAGDLLRLRERPVSDGMGGFFVEAFVFTAF